MHLFSKGHSDSYGDIKTLHADLVTKFPKCSSAPPGDELFLHPLLDAEGHNTVLCLLTFSYLPVQLLNYRTTKNGIF